MEPIYHIKSIHISVNYYAFAGKNAGNGIYLKQITNLKLEINKSRQSFFLIHSIINFHY